MDVWWYPRRALLVIPKTKIDYLDEALSLAETALLDIRDIIYVKKKHPATYLSDYYIDVVKSSLESNICDALLIFDDLKPRFFYALFSRLKVDIIDRVMLILTIFAMHAGSKEAKLQIELARISHLLPIVREWIRRSKERELPGFLGPGGYAIDYYYKFLTSRASRIRRELRKLKELRESKIKSRRRKGMPHVAITGYTCAGKTTLFNRLTGLSRPVGDEMFTTVSPKTYAISVDGIKIAFTDTIGFIRDIPPFLVEAFHATLAEITSSDLVLLVVDASENPAIVKEKLVSAASILREIGASSKPLILVANKCDAGVRVDISDLTETLKSLHSRVRAAIPVSAKTGFNVDRLLNLVCSEVKNLDDVEAQGLRAKNRS